VPDQDKEGKPVSKGIKGKLPKDWDTQAKAHAKYLTQLEHTPQLEQTLVGEVEALKAELDRL
jgi:hypothetical protein